MEDAAVPPGCCAVKKKRDDYQRVIDFVKKHPNDDPHGGVRLKEVAKALKLTQQEVLDYAENAEDDIIVNVAIMAGGATYELTRGDYILEPI